MAPNQHTGNGKDDDGSRRDVGCAPPDLERSTYEYNEDTQAGLFQRRYPHKGGTALDNERRE